MNKEVMKQVLEALEEAKGVVQDEGFSTEKQDVAITSIRQAIAELESQDGACQHCAEKGCVACDARKQEPVACNECNGKGKMETGIGMMVCDCLYTTPQQRKPLTEQEIGAILEDTNAFGTRLYTFARAIEAAHGIKE